MKPKNKPYKPLLKPLKKKAGRSHGQITVRHQGGGAKRQYRLVDFKQNRFDEPAKVLAVEYDPNRTGYIALIEYNDKKKSYILAPEKLKIGQEIISSTQEIPIKVGNRLPLVHIPGGTAIHNLELRPNGGGKVVRSAGASATIVSQEEKNAIIKMPSGEMRKINNLCRASIGVVSNIKHSQEVIGKAGRMRHKGVRPTVRGKAMYPAAHPHGGGEGVNPIGLKYPKTPWGKPARGVKTRGKKKITNKFIVQRRK